MPLLLIPETDELGETTHVYSVFVGIIFSPPSVGFIVKISPLHIVLDIATNSGFGFTFTFSKNGTPIQFPLIGVIV